MPPADDGVTPGSSPDGALPECDPSEFRHCLYLVGPGQFTQSLNERMGVLDPRKVRVKLLFNGHSQDDVRLAQQGVPPHVQGAILLGGEAVGEVVKLGSAVENFKCGELVALEPILSCGQCWECLSGRYHLCSTAKSLGKTSPGWTEGTYATSIDWPSWQCSPINRGGDSTINTSIITLAASMAACRHAADEMASCTSHFSQGSEYVAILGDGDIAAGLLLELLERYQKLIIIVMYCEESTRIFAEQIGEGRVKTLPLPELNWVDLSAEQQLLLDQIRKNSVPADLPERFRLLSEMALSNRDIDFALEMSFQDATRAAENRIASVLDTTGNPAIAAFLMKSRIVRGEGSYGFVNTSHDTQLYFASIRQNATRVFAPTFSGPNLMDISVRRLHQNEDRYRPLIGRVVPFQDLAKLHQTKTAGTVGWSIGNGPKVIVKY